MTHQSRSHEAGSGLHRFAVAWVGVTFCLVVLGGTVTSKGVGLAVPDWPTTFDYNMFLFPPSMWKGGVFWEHTHRLLGSVVGLMTIVVAVWLWVTQRSRRWLRWLGIAALVLVIIQGVMGGLRVTELDYRWGVAHGVMAQVFLCLAVLIAAATGRFWAKQTLSRAGDGNISAATGHLAWVVLGVMLIQLVLGASMRHSGSGLAIPDFPSAYGQLIPPLTDHGVEAAIDAIPYDQATTYYTAGQVGVHFAHRVWAVVVAGVLVWLIVRVGKQAGGEADGYRLVRWPIVALAGLLVFQLALGATVIWSGRHPEVATAHQATGAAMLATLTLLVIRIHLLTGRVVSRCDARRGVIEPATQPVDGLQGALT